jgi:hypothetical protein
MAILNNSNAISTTGGYDINNSLRFRRSASAYLNRTPASATNQKTWTLSIWLKRGELSTEQNIFGARSSGANQLLICRLDAGNNLIIFARNSSSTTVADYATAAVFRDPSAWYHIVVAIDTTQATSANRLIIYINGTQQTLTTTTAVPQNTDLTVNSIIEHGIGFHPTTGEYVDGYLAETYFVDGQQLTPSSFGETSTTTGSWIPKAYTGTYGTNGFYLKFSDIATTSGSNAGLGKDFSGNANYWTTNNISVTAGTTYDAMIDSPTLTSATVANYPTWNPLKLYTSSALTLSNANLTASDTTSAISTRIATMSLPTTGKWYWEITVTAISAANGFVGAIDAATANGNSAIQSKGTYRSNGEITNLAGTLQTGGASYTNADIIGVAVDVTAGTVQFYKNNVAQGSTPSFSFSAGTELFPYVATDNNAGTKTFDANFGQRPFSYTPPSGFVALNTFNLPDSTIVKGNTVMDATTYTGNGTSLSITNAGAFKPDFVWIKSRSNVYEHVLSDSVRGAGKGLFSNLTNAENASMGGFLSFDSNGWSMNGTIPDINNNAYTYVGWQWQAGQGTTSSNTAGTITSTVSVNATAGFSIVTYTGTGANATVGHGLGVAPKMLITKNRSAASDWRVWITGFDGTEYINLNESTGKGTSATQWNSTVPTSSVFSLGTAAAVNGSGNNLVAYLWAEIAGFSKFGSYTGNGSSDGPFVYIGFKPKYLMVKRTDTTGEWAIYDIPRDLYNPMGLGGGRLQANTSNAETGADSAQYIDFLSNGFKIRNGSGFDNDSGATYIYMAFAENPFKNSNSF